MFVYYSGHADEQALHLGNTRLSLDELRGLVQGSAAAFRLSILDACRSGGLTRVKGGAVVPRTTFLVRDDVVGEGTVFLTATSADEDAQESDEIRGSFFTHYFVTGLLGAADDDGDGAVDLNEAYRFAYDHTLRASSRTLGGIQHPTFQQDLKGKGQMVLTRWSAGPNRAFFVFPPGQSWLLIRRAEGGPIVAEVSLHSGNRTIGVRPGTYFDPPNRLDGFADCLHHQLIRAMPSRAARCPTSPSRQREDLCTVPSSFPSGLLLLSDLSAQTLLLGT